MVKSHGNPSYQAFVCTCVHAGGLWQHAPFGWVLWAGDVACPRLLAQGYYTSYMMCRMK